jgi:transcriptional regulator with XRE-family HTH domain
MSIRSSTVVLNRLLGTMNAPITYVTRLGEILDKEGRSQTWLARQIGVSRSTISQYVNGLHVPDDKRGPIAEALEREIGDVFGEVQG